MILVLIAGAVTIVVALVAFIASKVSWMKYKDKDYYEVTILLGSGGHTGELCQLLNHFKLDKVNRLNVLITTTDKSSEGFFRNYIKANHSAIEQNILEKLSIHYLPRTN